MHKGFVANNPRLRSASQVILHSGDIFPLAREQQRRNGPLDRFMTQSFPDALKDLRRHFAAALPGKLQELDETAGRLERSAWHPRVLESLRLQVHGLAASTGAFGLQSLWSVARGLEVQLKQASASNGELGADAR
ncbi:hypothetical protein RZS08_13115, partial [Arthrospira platensis SPKY1]|nr:hypothetical protein [Arthrospira platensis SPKY1]